MPAQPPPHRHDILRELRQDFIALGLEEDDLLGTGGQGDQAYSIGPAGVILELFEWKYERPATLFRIDNHAVYIR
jgi:hypothetical protein